MDNHDDILEQLRAMNPVPSCRLSEADKTQQRETLERILPNELAERRQATPRNPRTRHHTVSRWLSAAATIAILAGGAFMFPRLFPASATAEEMLDQAASAAASQPDSTDFAVGSADFLVRTDADDTGSVTVAYRTGQDGTTAAETQASGTLSEELRAQLDNPLPETDTAAVNETADVAALAAAISPDSPARGALRLLLTPGLDNRQQKNLYHFLSELEGNELATVYPARTPAGADDVVSIIRETDRLSFDILPATGQLVRVHGLLGEGITTTVTAAAILNCVSVDGLTGPKEVVLSCGDANYTVDNLRWDTWRADTATAHGTAHINDCDPFCAEGTFHQAPVTVTARDLRDCGYNTKVYSKLDIAYEQPWPFTPEFETIDIGCAAN
ncbi:MAG: hypothetical protein Q4D85_00760 [Corynebacterium sp.]|uniref:hypothetical protein n=1 Tax=Corynebacterium sp. TaxID=1720 RepID=UPI0026DD08B6|nr:hypothetical protein [Corynebacterium sp.]MDO5097257.1 hypothetical protein [Corynebacterium sp.]